MVEAVISLLVLSIIVSVSKVPIVSVVKTTPASAPEAAPKVAPTSEISSVSSKGRH